MIFKSYGAPPGVMVMDPINITGSVPAVAPVVYTAGADQPAGPTGVASDAEIAAANRMKNMKIAGSVAAALLVGWLVLGKRSRR